MAWRIYYDIIKPHISALSIKDFHWGLKKEKDERLSPVHRPLGEGQVDLKGFLKTFKKDFPSALVTLHVEYLPKAGVQENIAAIKKDSVGGEVDPALIMDGLTEEREQGITIDVAYRYFSTAKRKFIIADTPGHEQYTRNMATGASTADLPSF